MTKKITFDDPSSPETRGKRIRYVRDHLLGLTREEFCKDSDISAQSIKGWELAWGGGLSITGAEKICKRAKHFEIYCTPSWLMHGIGTPATHVTKDLEIHKDDENHIAKELLLFRELPKAIDTLIKDDAMIPFLYPGNYVGGIMVENFENAIGKECIIVDDKNNIYVRTLNYGEERGRYNLNCINQQPSLAKKEIKNINLSIVAPIVWIRKMYRET